MKQDELLIKLFNEVAYVWPRVGYPPLVTPFSQYVKNLSMMNVIAMEKGKERWGMIADDIWDMLLGKAGKLPGQLAPEIIEKAEREGRKFFTGNPQDNYPDALDKYRKLMKENKWELGEDDEELFEYAMHPAQYEAYKSGKAKQDFLEDVEKRRAERDKSPLDDAKPKTLTVQVDGQAYRVTVAYGDIDLPASATEKVYEVIRQRIFSQAQGTPVHPRCHWSTPDFLSGASWSRTTFSGFSVPHIHQVCQSSLLMLPQMESNHHLQIQNLPHYRYAIGQVCGG